VKVIEFAKADTGSGWPKRISYGGIDGLAIVGVCLKEEFQLPKNFSWLEPSKLAGCARPESEPELKALREQGIRAIISLTGTPLIPEVVSGLGFEYLHSHMSGSPTVQQLEELVEFIERENAQSKPVLVHCGEGKGRTGTVLAAYLVKHGVSANEAIQIVREKRPGSIQTAEQEDALRELGRIRDSMQPP
jgi:atypical dual specificity phosphatase